MPAYKLRRKRRAATAATSRIRVRKCESRSHDASNVIDLDTVQVLTAKHIDEELDALLVKNEVALARILFNIQTVLKTRTSAGDDPNAKSGGFGQALFAGHKFLNLSNRAVSNVKCHCRCSGWCAS